MLVAGVIAEYNPFHNGHNYQLTQIRRKTNAEYIIVAMSGNFVQRGVPAIMDKYARTRLALSQGADLVIEIPTLWATASAEYYAKAGVTLLQNTGVVNYLGFGAECDTLSHLEGIADVLSSNSPQYQNHLQIALKNGCAFPLARMHALQQVLCEEISSGNLLSDLKLQNVEEILSSPNNILAIEYLRVLHSTSSATRMKSCLIQRIGNGYHDDQLTQFASATAIRKSLRSCSDVHSLRSSLQDFLSENVLAQLVSYWDTYGFVDENHLSSMLGYQLYSHFEPGYTTFADCSFELSQKIKHQLPHYECFTQFCEQLKTKEITHTRLSRVLLHILLQITKTHYAQGKSLGMIPYLRVLGFKRDAAPLLHSIKQQATVPMITKLSKAEEQLPEAAHWMLEKDIFASNIYNQLLLTNKKSVPKNDYSQELILL